MRAPVSTWMHASAIAAVANQAFDAIVEEKTDVMMSVYFEATLTRNTLSTATLSVTIAACPHRSRAGRCGGS
jgi:hypothetical protein